MVHPKGFNVIATANTKGKGSDDGRFIGTNVLNEAFLERFPVTFERSIPLLPSKPESSTNCVMIIISASDLLIGQILSVRPSTLTVESEIISTRRLVHIVQAYNIFGDKAKAIQVCVNRFDDETKQAFLELYDKVDADFEMPVENNVANPTQE